MCYSQLGFFINSCMAMKKTPAFLTLLALLAASFTFPSSSSPVSIAASDSTYRADYFYFQTTGSIKVLLSEATYRAVLAAAQAAGYSEDEIEVTIYVVDRKSRLERQRPSVHPNPASRRELRKPVIKKFE